MEPGGGQCSYGLQKIIAIVFFETARNEINGGDNQERRGNGRQVAIGYIKNISSDRYHNVQCYNIVSRLSNNNHYYMQVKVLDTNAPEPYLIRYV